jgi:hypothetical protein
MGYEVIDNFLSEEDFKKIKDMFFSDEFPWFLNPGVLKLEGTEENLYDYQFTHAFFKNNSPWSDWLAELDPLMDKIKPNAILRIKANLVPRTEEVYEHGWHTDYDDPIQCKTAVLYINSNDGYTIFKDSGEKINSLENRFVVFDSNMEHSGSTCTDQKVRIVLNINYI